MFTLPRSLIIHRNKTAESKLIEKTRAWLEKDSSDRKGIHASDLLDPRKAYFDKKFPQPMTNRMVGLFFVGKVLHVFFLSALFNKDGVDWKSDGGSTIDKELGISYSPDWKKDGVPGELKTSRGKYEMANSDLSLYLEQEIIYQAAEKSTKGRLVVLMMNLPAPRGEGVGTFPQYRAYDIEVSKADLMKYRSQIIVVRKSLEKALKTNKFKELPVCRPFKCGAGNCAHYEKCKPEGRYGTKRFDHTFNT